MAGGVVCGDAVLGERGVAGLRVEWADALFGRQRAAWQNGCGQRAIDNDITAHSVRFVLCVSCRAQRGCGCGCGCGWKNGRHEECARQTQRSCRSATGGSPQRTTTACRCAYSMQGLWMLRKGREGLRDRCWCACHGATVLF